MNTSGLRVEEEAEKGGPDFAKYGSEMNPTFQPLAEGQPIFIYPGMGGRHWIAGQPLLQHSKETTN